MIFPPLLIIVTATAINALPEGAPPSVCQTLTPFHGGGIPPQIGLSPYSIVPRRQGNAVLVSVGSTLGVRFQGVMLQGRTINGQVLGSFQTVPEEAAHTINCADSGDSVTHNSPREKDHLDVVWIPPPGYEGPVVFNSTIAQNYNTFWVGVESPTVQITRRSVDDPPLPPRRPSYPTTPSFVPIPPRQAPSSDFNPFFDGCDSMKLCFGFPENCVASRSCVAAAAVTVRGDSSYEFELWTAEDKGAAWVGAGLSDDDKMGDDSVIECSKTDRGTIQAFMTWNYPGYKVERIRNAQHQIQLLNSSIVNGAIYCRVRRNAVTEVNGKTFDLVNDKFHLLVASGTEVTPLSIGYHTLGKAATAEKRSLADVSSVAGASKLLLRLHGSFMLAAWIGTASIGILLARYYRQTWVGTTMMGKDLWFAWHRIFMVLTWLLTITAFVLIFVELKAWSAERNPHAILGTITTILCFFQPIGAYFRPHPGTTKRPLFNWAHWLVGNSAHIIAIVTIFFAVKLSKAELPDFFDYIMVAYVVVHVITHLVLSLMNCISEKSSESRVTSFPMKDLGGSGRSSAYTDRSLDAPFSKFRKLVLGFYIFIVLVLVIALIILVALAPIEEAWSSLRTSMKQT